jgi:uncharacterized protein YndB with AHSA1/START domain
MDTSKVSTKAEGRDLILTRIIEAPPEKVFRAWTEPETLKKWFAPAPFTTPTVETDVRPGGSSLIVMRGPDGVEIPCKGVYLEVVPNERLVFTDAYTMGWEPSEKPFMTVVLAFEPVGAGTRYTARIRHWSAADRDAHEKRGFHQGWAICTEQLAAVAAQ